MTRNFRRFFAGSTLIFAFALAPIESYADIKLGLESLDSGDVAKAATEFQASFEAGEGDGAFYLGRLFEFGLGTKVDMPRAANLYAAGAEAGSILAMNRLGLLYLEGTTLLRDYAEAGRNFCKAAELGDQNGQLNCALMLKDGRGMEQNVAKAVEYFEASAAQGNVASKNLLGQILLAGDGVPVDRERAMKLFNETADVGNAMGLFELANAAMEGETPDLVTAYAYANLATVRAHAPARVLRDKLESQMSNAQITAAQEKAKKWTDEQIVRQAETQQKQAE